MDELEATEFLWSPESFSRTAGNERVSMEILEMMDSVYT